MSLVYFENCSYKKSIAIFVNWRNSVFLYQSIPSVVLNAICFFLSSLIANMATILINFQQKFALTRSFQDFTTKYVNQKRFIACLKSASKFSLCWQGKPNIFLIEFYLAIDPSNLTNENDVTELG